MIRILQVFGALNRGGSETMLMNLYRQIDRSKIQFDFVKHTPEKCAYDAEIDSLGGKIYVAPKFKGYNIVQYKKWWDDFFTKHTEYQIIHGHLFTIAPFFFEKAHKFNRITIGHSHISNLPYLSIKNLLRRLIMLRLANTSDYKFACSESAGRTAFGKKEFIVLPNAIDSKKYVFSQDDRSKIRKEFNVQEKILIGNIGRLSTQKNQSFLLDIFNVVHEKNKQTALMIVGEGSLEQTLKQKTKKLGLDNDVIFTGSRPDVSALLSAMDVFVFPSKYEGLGIVSVEAQAAGLPTICADTIPTEACISDLVDYLSLSDSAEKWADVILKSTIKNDRPNMQKKIVDAGYDIHATANWLQEFYKKII